MKETWRFGLELLLVVGMIVCLLQNRAMEKALDQVDAGYIEIMQTKFKDGRTLAQYIKPGSLGIFKSGDHAVGCVMLKDVEPN